MLRALILTFAMAGNLAAQASPPAKTPVAHSSQRSTQPTPKLVSAALSSLTEDFAAEKELLALANKSRQEVGLPPLRAEQSLANAARAHARLMVDRQRLSHQFDGEVSLMPRLLETGLRLDQVGENVAYNASAEQAFEALMRSAPHRQNLLNARFSAVGIAAFWSDGRLYVVQDFAHQLAEVVPTSQR